MDLAGKMTPMIIIIIIGEEDRPPVAVVVAVVVANAIVTSGNLCAHKQEQIVFNATYFMASIMIVVICISLHSILAASVVIEVDNVASSALLRQHGSNTCYLTVWTARVCLMMIVCHVMMDRRAFEPEAEITQQAQVERPLTRAPGRHIEYP